MIRIVSFGYGHGEPPKADFTIDVRDSLRNPFADERLRELDAFAPAVLQHVSDTRGAWLLVRKLAGLVGGFEPVAGTVTVAFGCVGGRHRSAALAMLLEDQLSAYGFDTEIEHRDIHKPLLPARVHEQTER